MIFTISNELEYDAALASIEPFIQKGISNLSLTEMEELHHINVVIDEYENIYHPLPIVPHTITEMLNLKMYELKLKQRDLAKLLGVKENRLSEILNGKRKINIDFAKRL